MAPNPRIEQGNSIGIASSFFIALGVVIAAKIAMKAFGTNMDEVAESLGYTDFETTQTTQVPDKVEVTNYDRVLASSELQMAVATGVLTFVIKLAGGLLARRK